MLHFHLFGPHHSSDELSHLRKQSILRPRPNKVAQPLPNMIPLVSRVNKNCPLFSFIVIFILKLKKKPLMLKGSSAQTWQIIVFFICFFDKLLTWGECLYFDPQSQLVCDQMPQFLGRRSESKAAVSWARAQRLVQADRLDPWARSKVLRVATHSDWRLHVKESTSHHTSLLSADFRLLSTGKPRCNSLPHHKQKFHLGLQSFGL